MKNYKNLNIKGVVLDRYQLENYLEKIASDHILQNSSDKDTYPILNMKENFEVIEEVYHLLNEHIKLGIPIHPAGEWLLDNFYVIEETVQMIEKDMPINKYRRFPGISNGTYKGFARIYVLASEIVSYTDSKIETKLVTEALTAYQKKKTLSMDEIWNIGIFIQIALIQNIKDICEKIYFSQMQKYRVENILERLIEKKNNLKYKNLGEYKQRVKGYGEMKYPFIEYMSYRLKKYGKSAYSYINVLEEQVNKMGTSIEEVIRKEHFDIALKKVSMANCITSIKELLRMDFMQIFQSINGVEDILKKDPLDVYSKMDYKTKEYYRNAIKEISAKTKISEVYIAKEILGLCNRENLNEKQKHVGYYLIDNGKEELINKLLGTSNKKITKMQKAKLYTLAIWSLTLLIDIALFVYLYKQTQNILVGILFFIISLLPLQEIVVQLIQYILGKIVKPKLIPKLDFQNEGIPEEYSTFVVIPTILKSKEKVKELMRKLEVYYLANKSENLYFALLGDCSSGENKEEKFDKEVIREGLKQVEILNNKYPVKEGKIPRFNFVYRKRFWNGQEECYLGWERKRGLLTQFNEYLLENEENVFKENSLENWKKRNDLKSLPTKIKYIITLDSDTQLVLNTGLELIGAMAHILNKPELSLKNDVVVSGHALIQPRVGIDIESSRKNLFTKIFACDGGVDPYVNAISDIYQDNFGEGIFTGKGIYDLEVFSKVLKDEIQENIVLSHDLLEGSYLRCGLASDIVLMDGCPSTYSSSKLRIHRWTRGDFQICSWIQNYIVNKKEIKKKNPLNFLSRYKILDNLLRAVLPIMTVVLLIASSLLQCFYEIDIGVFVSIIILATTMPTIIDLINKIIFRKEGNKYQKSYEPTINSFVASILRGIIALATLPDKAYNSLNAMVKSIYRMKVSKKHLLEWTTSEEAEKLSKTDLKSYYATMIPNLVIGVLSIIYSFVFSNFIILAFGILWLLAPYGMWFISRKEKEKNKLQELSDKEKEYLLEIGQRTWQFFKENINEKTNYLIPDNYQEDRRPIIVPRTSSTNIGLGLLAVVSSYDLGYENLNDTLELLNKMINVIESLQKWHGHLYNWYNTNTLEPLMPRYISTVDSGNFVSYVYVLKQFYMEAREKIEKQTELSQEEKDRMISLIPYWADKQINEIPIANADFTKLYDKEKRLFSIGFNIEENKLTPSYYDLLASEARTASFVAIARKDIPAKHWYNLNRTLTVLDGHKGLISWSGTAFEYLMPNINMKKYKGSLLDESCKFMISNQEKYAKKLGIPWGFSETAFNMRDLSYNYQYKAIGIPWLGLKRGLEDDVVVASYASLLALTEKPKEVVNNLRQLEKYDMYDKYGFYESVDYTPVRLRKGKKYETVKTYMAHHQALILLSINNLFKENVLVKRFNENPELEALDILLQEKMPENMIITKEEKTKPEKIKYIDYESYAQRTYNKVNERLNIVNAIANDKYLVVMDQKGEGYSKYKDILINRFKPTKDETQGITFYLKNIRNKRIWTSEYKNYLSKPDKYEISFSEDVNKIKRIDGAIQTTLKVTTAQEEAVEIRNINIKNNGLEEETLEVTAALEPILSKAMQDYAHPSFNNLFLTFEYIGDNTLLVKRRKRTENEQEIYMTVSFYNEKESIGELEYEIDKEKFQGRGNLGLPIMVENSKPFSKNTNLVLDPIIAMKQTIKIKPEESINLNLVISVAETREETIRVAKEYSNFEKINQCFELSRARAEAEARYLGLNYKDIETYQKMLGYILYQNPLKKCNEQNTKNYPQSQLWKYGISGDLPIVLLRVKEVNDIYVLEEMLKAYEFYRAKKIQIDLIILDEEPNSYERYVKEAIINSILNKNLSYMQNIRGGIFIVDDLKSTALLEFRANIVIDSSKGPIARQLKDLEDEYLENVKEIGYEMPKQIILEEEKVSLSLNEDNLKYYNEYGGFSEDGKEYIIRVNKENRLPTVWSHVIANEKFGSLVTESLGGFTWSKNSRLNRISAWSNNQVVDVPSEVIYLKEEETGKTWSLGLNPMPDNNDYIITYGFGYAKYNHTSMEIMQELKVFVAKDDSIKINLLNLKNLAPKKKKLKLVYYIKPVLGEDETFSNGYINLENKENANTILMKNIASEKEEYCYIGSSEKISSYTGDKKFFIGNGTLANPEGLKKVNLNNENSLGKDTIVAIQIEVELEAFEAKNVVFVLGIEEDKIIALDNSYKYTRLQNSMQELQKVKQYWQDLTNRIQVNTPVESFNILVNGWLAYQSIVCRLWARSGFYQSGGAFGFRDQLQDTLGLKYYDTNFMKKQIIKHSKHQFIEGDVEHWWHDENKRGIRTRFSDDLLWLVYMVIQYIEQTGDYSILDIETPYKKGPVLEEGIDERYDLYEESQIKESIYKHCIRAIEKSLNFGEHGLPKMGSGDWNDSMSTVGNKGKGESVWLGFFLYDILNKFIKIINMLEPEDEKISRYKQILEKLKKSLNTYAWDGRWYKRAFTDDGQELGSIQNDECRIDGISQSWATISNAGDNDKKYISMEALENHLIDTENGIIKLLDPPFEKGKLEPGYIKSYLPGTRENGGQYTHGAIWAIIAEAMLGFGDKATELFRMINPIEHSKTKEATQKYKVEPYVIAADIYGHENLAGRGGWTWYTGSSSWMLTAAIEYILGLKIENNILKIEPCIASWWKEYTIRYQYGNSIYNIKVKNPNEKNTGVQIFTVNGQKIENNEIKLNGHGKIYEIEVIL